MATGAYIGVLTPIPADLGWDDPVGATFSGGEFVKTGATNWSSGYINTTATASELEITATPLQNSGYCSFGLTDHPYTGDEQYFYPGTEYILYFNPGYYTIYELGNETILFSDTYSANDNFAIRVNNGVVTYYKNDTLVYTSSNPANGEYYCVVAAYTGGNGFNNISAQNTDPSAGTSSEVARALTSMYIGVSGIARKIKKAYIGVANIARLWWNKGVRFFAANGLTAYELDSETLETVYASNLTGNEITDIFVSSLCDIVVSTSVRIGGYDGVYRVFRLDSAGNILTTFTPARRSNYTYNAIAIDNEDNFYMNLEYIGDTTNAYFYRYDYSPQENTYNQIYTVADSQFIVGRNNEQPAMVITKNFAIGANYTHNVKSLADGSFVSGKPQLNRPALCVNEDTVFGFDPNTTFGRQTFKLIDYAQGTMIASILLQDHHSGQTGGLIGVYDDYYYVVVTGGLAKVKLDLSSVVYQAKSYTGGPKKIDSDGNLYTYDSGMLYKYSKTQELIQSRAITLEDWLDCFALKE